MSAPAIELRGLTRHYGEVRAVDALDLTIQGPGVFGFLGANGAGKTTTLRMMVGLIHPTAGQIRLLGEPLDRSLRARIGYLPQEPAAYPWMTGRELLSHVGDLLGLSRRESRTRGEALLERCGIEASARGRKVGGWSGGMRQRLGLAQALLGHPDLLLLDEPVSALDPVGRAEVLDLLAELGREMTVFMSSHILADVERVSREVAIIDRGRLLVHEETEALKNRAVRPRVQVTVRGPAAPLAARLRGEAGVESVTVGQTAPGVDSLDVVTRDPQGLERRLAHLVAEAGLPLVSVTPLRPSLEDVFLRAIGRAPGTGEEEAA